MLPSGRTSPKLSFSKQTLRKEVITWQIFWLPVRRIVLLMTKSCRPVRIMSIRKHSIPQFNAYFCESNSGDGSTLLMTNLVDACESCRFVNFEYPILTMDFRPFHALRTWKVHVFIYSFHQATHFHTLVTPLEFWYVNTRFDFQYTMLLIFRHCLPPSTSGMLTDDLTSGVSICQWPYTNRSGSGVLDMYVNIYFANFSTGVYILQLFNW